jgi:hypothetical protein
MIYLNFEEPFLHIHEDRADEYSIKRIVEICSNLNELSYDIRLIDWEIEGYSESDRVIKRITKKSPDMEKVFDEMRKSDTDYKTIEMDVLFMVMK